MFNLSYLTYGYHGPRGPDGVRLACLYLPTIKAQLELPIDDVEGDGGWESRALLSSICGREDYRDGLNDEGVSLFEPEPVVTLADRVAEATRLTEADELQESFVTTPT